MKPTSPISRISGLLALLAMAVTMSGVTGGMVVCVAPDGHVAVEFAHHEDHGPAHSGPVSGQDYAYDSAADPSCTDIPLFINGKAVTRPDRLSYRVPVNGALSAGRAADMACAGLAPELSRPEADDALPVPLDSLRSIVLLI